MEFLSIWRILVRARVFVGLGVIAAALAGLAVVGVLPVGPAAAGSQTIGVARTQVLIDTPQSLINDLGARADSVGAQTWLLSDLLTGEEPSAAIARAARVSPDDLAVINGVMRAPTKISPLAVRASQLSTRARKYTVAVETSTELPIITLQAAAPDRATAQRLAEAATTQLTALAAARAPSPDAALAVKPIEPVRAIDVTEAGPPRVPLALLAFTVVFAMCCAGIVIGAGALRWWRGNGAAPPVASTT